MFCIWFCGIDQVLLAYQVLQTKLLVDHDDVRDRVNPVPFQFAMGKTTLHCTGVKSTTLTPKSKHFCSQPENDHAEVLVSFYVTLHALQWIPMTD